MDSSMAPVNQALAVRARQAATVDNALDRIDRAREHQAEFNDVFAEWPMEAPSILADEGVREYERRLAKLAKRQLPVSNEIRRKVQVNQLADDAFKVIKPQIYAACKEAIYDPQTVPPGQLRMLEVKDGNRLKYRTFIGQDWFGKVDGLCRPGRHARFYQSYPGWDRTLR
jgi:hypothetical protein